MNPDDPIRAILLMVGATVLFSTSDTISKVLSTSLPIVEIIWIRYLLFMVLAFVVNKGRGLKPLRPSNPGLQILRGVCMIGSSLLFVYGVRAMSMAQGTTISFLAPLLVTILSIPILNEVVGPRRWAAVGAGMLGMLIVVQPGTNSFQPAALYGLTSAACWATALIITRKISTTDAPQTTLMWTAGSGLLQLTVLLYFGWTWPSWQQWGLALILGSLASIGQYMVILAHRIAPASMLAPFSYSQLLWSTTWGFIVFKNLPTHSTWVGAAIIIASGLYTAHRERIRARDARERKMVAKAAQAV